MRQVSFSVFSPQRSPRTRLAAALESFLRILNLSDEVKCFLVDAFCSTVAIPIPFARYTANWKVLEFLTEAGLLVIREGLTDSCSFSCTYAKRYFFNHIFPIRSKSMSLPASVTELILKVIQNMSANTLSKSFSEGSEFPNEAPFQRAFLSAIAAATPYYVLICPELGRHFRSPSDRSQNIISGSLDLYLNGDLRWGIELLVGGDRLPGHTYRCSSKGKYSKLKMEDYIAIDFRVQECGEEIPEVYNEKLMTVYFLTDFKSCRVFTGEEGANTPLVLDLLN